MKGILWIDLKERSPYGPIVRFVSDIQTFCEKKNIIHKNHNKGRGGLREFGNRHFLEGIWCEKNHLI